MLQRVAIRCSISRDAGNVRALTVDSYDEQGRGYLSQTYNIDQSNGTSGLTCSLGTAMSLTLRQRPGRIR